MDWEGVERAAVSLDWETRVSAAGALADRWPESDLVQRLLADRDDLAVTQAMGRALLSVPNRSRLRAFVRGYSSADDQIGDALNDELRAAVGERPELLDALRELAPSEPGAQQAIEWLR